MVEDLIALTLGIGAAFESIGAQYFLGGRFASSLQGEPRATNDLDFVVDLLPDQVRPLSEALGEDFEVDEQSLADAVPRTRERLLATARCSL